MAATQTPPAAKPAQASPTTTPVRENKVVEFIADQIHPIPYRDTTATVLKGNFAAHHNGAVITADSAVRYSDKHLEFFGNVLINQRTTYIYGDRAEYNGEINEARVYAPLVKIVDGDAVLYTYNFTFNTLRKEGYFTGGGTMHNRDARMESDRGYYLADTHEMVGVGRVEMRNDTYTLQGDSVRYNTATERARFFQNTHIWNKEGDYMHADRGRYEKPGDLYALEHNGYVLTEKQELFSDSLHYFRTEEHVRMWRDIQLDDTDQQVLAFGDYGEYWKTPGDALLTVRPSLISYDTQQSDSTFMRADTIRLNTYPMPRDTVEWKRPAPLTRPVFGQPAEEEPSESLSVDTVVGGADTVILTPREQARKDKADAASAARAEKRERVERARAAREATMREKVRAKEEARRSKQMEKFRAREIRRMERDILKGRVDAAVLDSLHAAYALADSLRADSLAGIPARRDSLRKIFVRDSLRADSLNRFLRDSLKNAADTIPPHRDSIYRLVKGYRNAKIYQKQFQVVCDSMAGSSIDSVIRLYGEPVLWNEVNQISSDEVHAYTKNQHVERAEFIGRPIMISEVDTASYNQVSGRTITAHFRDDRIYRNDVDGQVRTLYYMQEEGDPTPVGFMSITAANASFYIENNALQGVMYRNAPEYTIFPMEKIPADQPTRLELFKWVPERRPTLSQVFDRVLRASLRAASLAIPRPVFPITERIDAYRKSLLDARQWIDRDDRLTPPTLEWLKEINPNRETQ